MTTLRLQIQIGATLVGLAAASLGLLAQSGTIVRSEPIPAQLMDWNRGEGLRWNAGRAVMARTSPSPEVAVVDEKLSLIGVREVGGFPGASHISVAEAAVAPNGDIAYFGAARNRENERTGTFLSFQAAGQPKPPTFVRTYPFAPRAITSAPDGRFLVLFLQVTDTHGEDYPAVRAFDSSGNLQETLVTAKQLKLPPDTTGAGSYGSSNPAIAAAGDFMFLYIPRLDAIQQWTLKGALVRSIPVTLPDGTEHSGVMDLAVTDKLRIGLTAYERISAEYVRRRVIFSDAAAVGSAGQEGWHDLLPGEDRRYMLRGSSGSEFIVQMDNRLLWVR